MADYILWRQENEDIPILVESILYSQYTEALRQATEHKIHLQGF